MNEVTLEEEYKTTINKIILYRMFMYNHSRFFLLLFLTVYLST